MLEFKGYAATELAAIKLKSTKTTRELFCNEIYIKPIAIPKKAFSLTFFGLWFVSEAKPCVVGIMTTNSCYLLGGLSALNLI